MERRSVVMRNIVTMFLTYVLTVILSFYVRAVFIQKLGSQYLGLNGVFTSILSVLSVSDLGMESVFSFLLYKPIAHKNRESIRTLIALFKKVYAIVGTVILVIGLMIIPFLPFILGKQGNDLSHVTLIYVILLINSAGSYFFTYNRTMLNADQKNYMITGTSFYITTIVNIFQIILLNVRSSMVVYVSLFLIGTLATNIILSRRVIKNYPYLKKLPKKVKLDAKSKEVLFQNTIGGLSNKLGSIVVFASDNILLSVFVNLNMVGLYSNYTLIMNSALGLLQKVFATITATIGNIAIKSPERGFEVFKQLNFYITVIAFFVSPQLFILLRPVISLWLGDQYVLSQYIVMLIIINFVLQVSRIPSLMYIDAYGLQWIQRWKSVIESILNIVLSMILLTIFHLGLRGVLLGTIGSTLFFVTWFEPYIVLKNSLKQKSIPMVVTLCKILLEKMTLGVPILTAWLSSHLITGTGFRIIVILSLTNALISLFWFLVMFWYRKEFRNLKQLF